MSNDERQNIGIARVLGDEQPPTWLEQNIKAVALEQAKLVTQIGRNRGPQGARSWRLWFARLNRAWLPIAGSVASLLLVVLLVTGNPTPPVTTTTEQSLPAKFEAPKQTQTAPQPSTQSAPDAGLASKSIDSAADRPAPAVQERITSPPTAPSTAPAAAPPTAPTAPTAPAVASKPAARADPSRRLERARTPAEPEASKRKAEAEPSNGELNDRTQPGGGVADGRQLPAAPAAASAQREQRGQLAAPLRKDDAADSGSANIAQSPLPETAAQCVTQVQTLLNEQREVDARRLFRRCGERFADLTWPETIRQRLGSEAATNR